MNLAESSEPQTCVCTHVNASIPLGPPERCRRCGRGADNRYGYDEGERDKVAGSMGKSAEIIRFKGLGEISPAEFKQFIGKEMKLSGVEYASKPEAAPIFDF